MSPGIFGVLVAAGSAAGLEQFVVTSFGTGDVDGAVGSGLLHLDFAEDREVEVRRGAVACLCEGEPSALEL